MEPVGRDIPYRFANGGAHVLRLKAHHDHDPIHIEACQGPQGIRDQRYASQGMEHLGKIGPHAGTLARGQNDGLHGWHRTVGPIPWEDPDVDGATAIQRALASMAATGRPSPTVPLPADWSETVHRLRAGPDPTGALQRAAGLPASWFRAPLPAAAVTLLHEGPYPARLMALVPEARAKLANNGPFDPDRETLLQQLGEAIERNGEAAGIGAVRATAYLQIGRREVEGAPLEETGAALSTLADSIVTAALPSNLRDRVVVMGMGKLGGQELNFLSDVDLIFVHADNVKTADVTAGLRTLVRRLEGEAHWRPVFRVDLRLRPFGRRGPLAMSLAATESYYERHGRPWERQAWIRGRPMAGNLELGHALLRRLSPFVYRRSVDAGIFDEVSALMLRARREASRSLAGDGDVDLKLDAGGIREVEFFAQSLQLLHGGRRPDLRFPSTLGALDRLLAAGLVSDREHAELTDAYRWLRHVEHRVQLGSGRQTHTVPGDPEARGRLARRITGETLGNFVDRMTHHRTRVSVIAQTLHGPSADAEVQRSDRQRRAAREAVLDPAAPAEVQRAALSYLGLADPEEGQALLSHIYARPEGPFSARGRARGGAEALLLDCLDAADPDMALRRLLDFASLRPAHFAIWRFLADPSTAERRRLCAELFGSSEPLSRGLVDFPHQASGEQDESMALLIAPPGLPTRAEITETFESHGGDPRGVHPTVLRHKQRTVVTIGLHDLGHRPDPLDVGRALSALADEVLGRIVPDLLRTDDPPFRLTVLGLGKLGMESMDYGSDLDLMFVYSAPADDENTRKSVTRVAQSLLAILSDRSYGGRLYEVDMRLRPSGRTGLLVSSLAGFRRYHQVVLPTWERLALLRVRPVVSVGNGSEDPGEVIVGEILPTSLFGPTTDPATVAADVRNLKSRIETEIARETRNTLHAKAGRGGCLEAELLVGALQLIHGRNLPSVRVRGIVPAVAALTEASLMTQTDASRLTQAYRFLRLAINRLRMGHARGLRDPERFSTDSPRLRGLARRMGLAGDADLVRAFSEHRGAVRDAFDRLIPRHS